MAFITPIASFWRGFVPRPVRKGLANVGRNFLYPGRLINNLLQGKWSEAGDETKRFFINTTYGILGWVDRASGMGIEEHQEDFGQTFHAWGWKNSTYFMVPILGPATIRDGLGKIPDFLVDPAVYFTPAAQVRGTNRLSDALPTLRRFVLSNYDAYERARLLYVLNRELDTEDYTFEREDGSATETLDSIFLTYEDPLFPQRSRMHRVELSWTGEELPYSVWLQPEPAPLVYILPGLGGHRVSSSTLGLAEIAYDNGNSVVVISSAMNYEFIAYGSTADLPGFAPVDAHDVHRAIDAIDDHIERKYPGRITSRRLAGISLGAFHTLFIAADEDPEDDLIDFDLYVALNSPVNFEHGVRQLDGFYNAPMVFPPEERNEKISALLRKVLDLGQGEMEPGMPLPFTKLEAEYLIGLAFRNSLRDIIFQTQERNDQGVLKTERSSSNRTRAYQEIVQFSFMEYVYAFVLPYYAEVRDDITFDEAGAQRLFELCDLRSIADNLRGNPKILFYSNENDFLLRDEDVTWVKQLFGDKATFFTDGGHLGNLYEAEIQQAVRRGVVEILEENGNGAEGGRP